MAAVQTVVFVVVWLLVGVIAIRMRLGSIVGIGGGLLLALLAMLPFEPSPVQAARLSDQQAQALVAGSHDFEIYREAFGGAAAGLIASGRCRPSDFTAQGGWAKASGRSVDTYFVFCGGTKMVNRVYLTPSTGQTFGG